MITQTIHFLFATFISLCLHAFLESMPLVEGTAEAANQVLTMGHLNHNHVHVTATSAMDSALFMGLVFHKFPVALVLMSLIKSTSITILKRWGLLVVFGLMPWFGMELYDYIIHSSISIPGGMNAFATRDSWISYRYTTSRSYYSAF